MAKTLMTLFLIVSFLIISQDMVIVEACCKSREECDGMACNVGFGTCVSGFCVCLADLKTDSTIHKGRMMEECKDCQTRDDCGEMKCEIGIATCIDGNCLCL
ncbi:putative defensin-like protein 298 [Lycium barbarum]|uniref:putative defensin-like protein 298 n=1 Tax=Lycium barbarum TaxID=112863 RepID=UPI00293E4219|nr:putative defensin-like protein 298 [Lycium barbarum]